METIILWVKNLVFYLVFLTLVFHLLPSGKYEKYVRLFAGMVFILVAVRPFTTSLRLDERIALYFEEFSFRDEAADFRGELNEMEKRRLEELTGEYEAAVAGQVREMAAESGVEAASVEVEIDTDRDSGEFGKVTDIRLSGQAGEGASSGEETPGRDGTPSGEEDPAAGTEAPPWKNHPEDSERIRPVKPVEIGGGTEGGETGSGGETEACGEAEAFGTAAAAAAEDPLAAGLRSRIADYYGLEESHVEIQLEHE